MAHAETLDIANDRAEKKKIAILLATYNGERYLAEQIESIRAQSYTNWHVYMHDDGSSDGTLEILRAYAAEEPERFTYVDDGCRARSARDFSDAGEVKVIMEVPTEAATYATANTKMNAATEEKDITNAAIISRGAKGNFFYLLERVEADYYMFCDQDDVWLPDKIAVTWAKMQEIARLYPAADPFFDAGSVKRGTDGEKAHLNPAGAEETCAGSVKRGTEAEKADLYPADDEKSCEGSEKRGTEDEKAHLDPASAEKMSEGGVKRGTEGEKTNLYPAAVFTELRVVDEQKNTICDTMSAYQGLDCSKTSFHRLMIQNVVTGCTMMINRVLRDEMLGRRVQSGSGGIEPPVSEVHKNEASASETIPSEMTKSEKSTSEATINEDSARENPTSEAFSTLPPDIDKIIMHDWWGAMIAAAFGRIAFVPEPTILYRQHGTNSVGAKAATSMGYLAKRMAKADEVRESLRLTREQAGEFARCFAQAQAYMDSNCSGADHALDTKGIRDTKGVNSETCISLALNYAGLGSKNKFVRLGFYIRHDAWKTNLSRNVGLIIFG